jgi:hypothetical protein
MYKIMVYCARVRYDYPKVRQNLTHLFLSIRLCLSKLRSCSRDAKPNLDGIRAMILTSHLSYFTPQTTSRLDLLLFSH